MQIVEYKYIFFLLIFRRLPLDEKGKEGEVTDALTIIMTYFSSFFLYRNL